MKKSTNDPSGDATLSQIILCASTQSQKRAPNLYDIFFALGNPQRRGVFEALCHHEYQIEDLVTLTFARYQGIREHLIILERCGMITSFKEGKYRYYHANHNALKNLQIWVALRQIELRRLN